MKRFCLKSAPLHVSYIALAWGFLMTPSLATTAGEMLEVMLEAQRKLGTHHHHREMVIELQTLETLSDHEIQGFFEKGRGAEVKKAAVLKELEEAEQEEARTVKKEGRLSQKLKALISDEKTSGQVLLGMARSIAVLREELDAAKLKKEALEVEAQRLRLEGISKDSHFRLLGKEATRAGEGKDEAEREAEELKQKIIRAEKAANEALKAYRDLSLKLKREELAEKEACAKKGSLAKEREALEVDLTKTQASLSETSQQLLALRGDQEGLVAGISSLMREVQKILGGDFVDLGGDSLGEFITGARIDDFLTKAHKNLQRMLLESQKRMESLEEEKSKMAALSERQQAEIETQKADLVRLEEEKRAEVAKLTRAIHKLEDEVQRLKAAQDEKESELSDAKSKLNQMTVEKESSERLYRKVQQEKSELVKDSQSLVERIKGLEREQAQAKESAGSFARLLAVAEASLKESNKSALINQEISAKKIRELEATLGAARKEAEIDSLGKRVEVDEKIQTLEASLEEAKIEHQASLLREKKDGEKRVKDLEIVLTQEGEKAVEAQEALVEKHKKILAAQRASHQGKLQELRASIAEQESLLEQKEHAISEGLTELDASRAHYQNSSKCLEDLEKSLGEQKALLMKSEEEKNRITSEASELKAGIEALTRKLTISEATVLRLKREFEAVMKAGGEERTRAEKRALQEKFETVEEQEAAESLRIENKEHISLLSTDLEDAKKENKTLKAEKKILNKHLVTAEKSLEKLSRNLVAKQENIDMCRKDIEAKQQDLLEIKEKMRTLEETQSSDQKAAAALMKEKRTEQAALKKAHEDLRKAHKDLGKEKEALQVSLKDAQEKSMRHEEMIKGARLQLVAIMPSEEESEGESINLKRIGRLVVKLQEENKGLSESIANGESDLIILGDEKGSLERILKEKEDLLSEKEKEKEERETLLKKMIITMEGLDLEIYKQSKEINAQIETEKNLRREIDAKEHRILSLEKTVLSLGKQKESLEGNIGELSESLAKTILENTGYAKDLERMRIALRESTRKVISLEEQIDGIEADLIEQNFLLMKRSREIKRLEEEAIRSQPVRGRGAEAVFLPEGGAKAQELAEKVVSRIKTARHSLGAEIQSQYEIRDKLQLELQVEKDKNEEIIKNVALLYPKYTKAQEDLLLSQRLLTEKEEKFEMLRRSLDETEKQKDSAIASQKAQEEQGFLVEAKLIEATAQNGELVAQTQALEDMLERLAPKAGSSPVPKGGAVASRGVTTPPPTYRESLGGPQSPAHRLIRGTPGKEGATPNRAAFEQLMKGASKQGRGDMYGKFLEFLQSSGEDVSPGSPLRKAIDPKKRKPLSSLASLNGSFI